MKIRNILAGAAAALIMCTSVFGADPSVTIQRNFENELYQIFTDTDEYTSSDTVLLFVNGDVITTAKPIIKNGTTLVPLKVISGKLGATVNWYGESKTASIVYESTTISATIGSSYIVVNGENVEIPSPAQIIDSLTYVPLRAIASAFGAEVGYDGTAFTEFEGASVKIVWVQNKDEEPAISKEEAAQIAIDRYFEYIRTDENIREQIYYYGTNGHIDATELTPDNISEKMFNGNIKFIGTCTADFGEYYYIRFFDFSNVGALIDKYDGSFYPVASLNLRPIYIGKEGTFNCLGPNFA